MIIQLNGDRISVESKLSIGDLIRGKALDPDTVVVECNRRIIKTGDLDRTLLKENDVLEILRFVGGG